MRKVSHKTSRKTVALPTAAKALAKAARRLARSEVYFGHGTETPEDDAAALLYYVMGWTSPPAAARWQRPLTRRQQAAYEALLELRIGTRQPAVYLTGTTWFAGLPLRTDARALVPRSPLAELIEQQFSPWVDPAQVRTILDLCTGGGCIALACAHHLPGTRVDATDISAEALSLARENRLALGLTRRVRLVESDHFKALRGRRYDIIVSNPPYVGEREWRSLPAEYRHEPKLGLAAGKDGLDSVRVILAQAARHLEPKGILVVEVGNTEAAVRKRWPRMPFTWLEFERGGGGVFLLTREQLQRHVR